MSSATALVERLGDSGALETPKLFSVAGWVAVVTGGGTGLGLVTALTLASNGAKVYITGRRLEPLQDAAKAFDCQSKVANGETNGHSTGQIVPVQADVSTKEGIEKLVQTVSAEEQWINLLVNNHGVSLGCANINDCPQTAAGLSKQMFAGENFETWLDTYKINCASYHFTTFALLPLLDAAKVVGGYGEPGNVINISSISGVTKTSQRGQFNYNASKAATVSLSNMLATEFARRGLGVRVNVICPGYFPTGMTVIPNENNTGSTEHTVEFRTKWGIPLGRPGNAIDYAQSILGLATNRYVTGAEHVIDGGWLLEEAF